MAIIHFMYTNEKRVVSIVRAAQRKPAERQPKHPVHAGRDGERPQDECSFSFYNNRKSPKPHRSNGLSPSRPHSETRGATTPECREHARQRSSHSGDNIILLHKTQKPDDKGTKQKQRKIKGNAALLPTPDNRTRYVFSKSLYYTYRVLYPSRQYFACLRMSE